MPTYEIIGGDGKEYGPFSAEEIRRWITEVRVNRDTRTRVEGSNEWKSLSEFPEFAESLTTPPAPAPMATGVPAPPPERSGLATSSLVLGILGLLTCGLTGLVGLILGIIALVTIKRSRGTLTGTRVAVAGTVVSGLSLLLLPLLAGIIRMPLVQATRTSQGVRCMNNMKQLALAAIMYASDKNDQLPSGTNWCNAIQGYLGQGAAVFRCPDGDRNQPCHYAFNSQLSGVATSKITAPADTVMVFECDGGWNVNGGAELLPQRRRHGGSVGLVFADGHAEIAAPARLQNVRWQP